MKIALVRVNYNSHIITPPLGIGYIASYLKNNSHEVLIIDALRDNFSNEEILQKINDENIDVVGITCLSAFYNEVVDLSKLLKKNNKIVIIGGVHPTFLPKDTLIDSQADYIIIGEGEIATKKLLDNFLVNNNIQGVYSLDNLVENPVRGEVIENLDELPFPDWEQITPNSYPKAPHGALVKNYPIGVVMSSRGCPYACKFCASPQFYNRKVRFRSPKNVVDEIDFLVKHYGVKEIHFEDDNLTLNREHISEICNLIIERNLKISFACPNGIRADKVDKDLILLMKKAGCYYFAYGIESANQQILNNINKSESIETINHSIDIASECGISCQGFFIFGLPGETKDTINESINFALKSKLSRAQFLILDVLPGCELYNDLKGQFVSDFSKNSYKEPEWIPDDLTREDLMKAQSTAFKKFYLRFKIFFYLARLISLSQIKFLIKRLFEYRIINKH